MNRKPDEKLLVIEQALDSPYLADIAAGYVITYAYKESVEKNDVIVAIRQRLLRVAAEDRDVDGWTSELRGLEHKVGLQHASEQERRGLAATLTLLFPFAKQASLRLAADLITTIRGSYYSDELFLGEKVVIGSMLEEVAALAEARGNLALASDIMHEALVRRPSNPSEKMIVYELFHRSTHRSAAILGTRPKASTLLHLAYRIRKNSTDTIHSPPR